MDANLYSELRAYTAQKGAVAGGLWIVSFASFVGGLTHPGLSLVCLLAGAGSVFVVGQLIRNFRQQKGDIGFLMAWWAGWMMFIYASLLLAAAQYIYFRFMDNGFVANMYATLLQQPEVEKMLQGMSGANYRTMIEESIATWQTIRPIELTFEFLISNIFLSMFLSLLAAVIGSMGKGRTETNSN